MGLDPVIAAGAKPIEIENPLEQYARALQIQGFQQSNALGKYNLDEAEQKIKSRNALNTAYQKAYDQNSGKVDYNILTQSLADQGLGSTIPGIQKAQVDLEKDKADIQKVQYDNLKTLGDSIKQRTEFFRQRLNGVTTPEQYLEVQRQTHADPVLGPYLEGLGATLDKSVATVNDAIRNGKFKEFLFKSIEGAGKAAEQQFHVVNTGGEIKLIATNKYGDPNPRVVRTEKVTLSPNRSVTNNSTTIVTKVEGEYGKTWGTEVAKDDVAVYQAARKAPEIAQRSDRITELLQSGKIITGSGADLRLTIAKALNLAGGNDAEKIANTEVLVADLANNTLAAIKASGLGSGQGFSNTDREFLEKAVGGRITLNRETLLRLTALSRRAAERSADAWNTRVKHIPASALQGTGVSTNPITIPKRKTPVKKQPGTPTSIPQQAIRDLRRNPGTSAQFDQIFGKGAAARVLRGR